VLYDHRGHGRSTMGTAGTTIDALADDLRAVLDHVDARDAVVAGHSMGGMTTQAFAIRHPDVLRARVGGLVLVATACDRTRTGLAPTLRPWTVAHPITGALLARPHLGRVLIRPLVGEAPSAAYLDAVNETFLATAPDVRAGFLEAIVGMDLSAGLPGVDVPVIVLSGTKDRLTVPAASRRIVDLLPRARLEVIPGAGHMLPWEAPDRVVAAITRLVAVAPAVAPEAVFDLRPG
jgi:non-heme chloroperoxidase